MKLSEMRQCLEAGGIRLTKSLGQNFLHDANQLRRIVAAAGLTRADRVLEIGPGLGPLTERLLAEAGEVLAIEKDSRLVDFLRRRWPAEKRLTLVQADALEFVRSESRDWTAWKLVANLPYSVASPILVELAGAGRGPERMIVTLQLEVAQRLQGRAGGTDYGVLSLLVQLHYEPQGWFKIAAGCFFPAPNVDSACVTLIRRPQPLLHRDLTSEFVRLIKRCFSQRRKRMLKLLKQEWDPSRLEPAFHQAGVPSDARAETVSLEQFVQLTRLLSAGDGPQP
jgi:16S rRNA (adenine1518-N6/adenine1519-N6)-dimethyltransferase